MAESPEPNRPPRVLAFPPTSSTLPLPSSRNSLEVATVRLVSGPALSVAMPTLRPWFSPGERKAAKVRRRVIKRAVRRRLERPTR